MKEEVYTVILFYKFITIKNPTKFRDQQRQLCESLHLKGRMLLATEGVNATFEGRNADIKEFEKKFKRNKLFKEVVFKESSGNGQAFSKLEVKVRDEVVTLGTSNLNIGKETAKKITAKELQALYQKDEDFVILDLRNDFEIEAGHFEKTVNPKLRNFRDLPNKLNGLEYLKNKKVIAVCTGGIRCEKATPLLKQVGFKDLYQLKDGIHSYMQEYPSEHFKGALFVFDNRMITPVVENISREIAGKCVYCQRSSEDFYNDDSIRPSRKVICCNLCISEHQNELRQCIPV